MLAVIENLKTKIRAATAVRNHSRLVRHYFVVSLVLISGGLITSGLSELYFRYRESAADLVRLQQEITSGAASKMEHFIQEIERTTRGAAKSREITEKGLSPEYRFELRRLLVIAPAITEAVAIDRDGIPRVTASRFTRTLPSNDKISSMVPALQMVKEGTSHFGSLLL
jgi:hypothetical protein